MVSSSEVGGAALVVPFAPFASSLDGELVTLEEDLGGNGGVGGSSDSKR